MMVLGKFILVAFIAEFTVIVGAVRQKRSIDLIAAHSLISQERLPTDTAPSGYHLFLRPDFESGYFEGYVVINVTVQHKTYEIVLHAHKDLQIELKNATQVAPDDEELKKNSTEADAFKPQLLTIESAEKVKKKPLYQISFGSPIKPGAQLQVYIQFSGPLFNDTSEGFFRSSYPDIATKKAKWLAATHMRPNMARSVFPCYDEPAYKVPMVISVARPKHMIATSNMPVEKTTEDPRLKDWVWDTFQKTPPIATYSIGVVISELSSLSYNLTGKEEVPDISVTIWARPDFINAINDSTIKIDKTLKILAEIWGTPYPLPKIDIYALPNYQATKPADAWGLILFKESELSGRGSWHIAQELVYQWLGALATPFWWSDAHINNALVRYVTAYTTIQMQENETFSNWPMTMLYSIYYEFSKRYPHGKNTAIKQDSTSAKTELVFRMLNYTLGEETFKRGLQRFMADRQYKTFFGDDIWLCITEQARFDEKLPVPITVNEIAASWITKDRLPVLTVTRNYTSNTATLTQQVYLRERPHDVPDQDKYLWWIPVVLVRQDKLDFHNSTPFIWMRSEREIQIEGLPRSDSFVIINPEEIGPFPVNYDAKNWNMLSNFLNSPDRTQIPVTTRAKLLHDAWNLAFAGNLSFSIALDMTLFLKDERDYLAWDPVFTLIDHIGKHIDSSPTIHKKFQNYVRLLLSPLYEELGSEPKEGEGDGTSHLRSSLKIFVCQAGYSPCIEEAQAAYRKWMEAKNPDEGNPVANQYICPVFKWGTMEEWEFGLQRVLNFPSFRKQNERTYLLKTLAGCPNAPEKIEKLLTVTVLEKNVNFSDNDIYLLFSMISTNANGYNTTFEFLKKNWNAIKKRFEDKPYLWNSMVTAATNSFKTEEGLDRVRALYVEKQNEFGTADFVIEKALVNLKEEVRWSKENLPVIEKWLDNYISIYGSKNSMGR
ncbi:unnamed protein product [Acanthoscelides obtectus]|uniref:Aminopeptidase n=1 Tax=Acanthoscelides obtectus TaxID=200917 RepID=A0A9P0KI47_ACAOB|nr:unnamed protein product [Acanthoscelides obtectus]CAK1666674.1 Aminopeptidase N [Acanthoscelides obtectus]